jgi:ubiquinone/menaquinone biosynthesis C-methylase UbiE
MNCRPFGGWLCFTSQLKNERMGKSVNYDIIAPGYDRRYKENDYSGVERVLLNFVGMDLSAQILEVGCGTGHWLTVLDRQGYRVAGLDASRSMVSLAKSQVPHVALVHGHAEALPLKTESFDRIFCINALHHFSDKTAFMIEARRVLRRGGSLMSISLDPHTNCDHWWIYNYFPQVIALDKGRYLSVHEIRQMMISSGFTESHTLEAQHMVLRVPARESLDHGHLAKTATSQLALLTDDEYIQGIRQIQRDIETAETRNEVLTLSADLRLYATIGLGA